MQLDLRQRAVLGVFIQFPEWTRLGVKGLRPTHIWKIAPHTFKTMLNTAGPNSPRPAILQIAATCKKLCSLGLMVEVGRVQARFLPDKQARTLQTDKQGYVSYESPVFAPTEAGMLWAITNFKWEAAPVLKFNGRLRHRDTLNHSLTRMADFKKQFELMILFDADEAHRIKAHSMRTRHDNLVKLDRANQRRKDAAREARKKARDEEAAKKKQQEMQQPTEWERGNEQ